MSVKDMAIPFIDLAAQQSRIRSNLDLAISNVLDEGQYIMGPHVANFERAIAEYCGAKHCLSCANGTDALQLALMALGIKAGDAVFVPAFTFAATAEVVPFLNATPIFVDVDENTFNMDPESLKRAIIFAKSAGFRPACVIPVDLFGLPADYDPIISIARENGMFVVGDSAQGFGGVYKGRMTGYLGDITTTSFFPAKPLGCYGDGGAVFTDDDDLASLIDSFRVHGKGTHKYYNDRIGMNSRLDTLQAAILIEKLAIYEDETKARQRIAERYNSGLSNRYATPYVPDGSSSIWAQYTLKMRDQGERDAFQARAKDAGIPTVIYYPVPLHRQNAYKDFPSDPAGLSISDDLSKRVVSLPMHPYLTRETQDVIIEAVGG
jgi:dTDP-4-amino-4,6-dideoxygalactose transaminase